MRFKFIRDAIEEVSYPRFFGCDPLTDQERKRLDSLPQLPPSYLEFLNTFGKARFFRALDQDRYQLLVFPPPDTLIFCGDSYMMDVGSAQATRVCFRFSELGSGIEPPLYDIALGIAPASPRRRADSFMDWLNKSWERCRSGYAKKAWEKVLAGPVPFSPEEQCIVETRRQFSWKQLPPQNGMVTIEFTNASNGRLPRYSIGVKKKFGTPMVGGFWVDVAHVGPGQTAVVHVGLGGYSHLMTAEMAVLFDLGEPAPESRGDFPEIQPIIGGQTGHIG